MMNGINNGIQQTVKQPALLAGLALYALFSGGKKG